MAVEFAVFLPREEIAFTHDPLVGVVISSVLIGVTWVGHLLLS